MAQFTHLHNHTHYSLLDGACTPEKLIKAAVEDGQEAIALTDHGVMFGCYDFYKQAKKAGIKPILGCEVYVANGSRFDKDNRKAGVKKRNYYHLVLLAKNNIGYKNLMKLVSFGFTEGFYYKPRIDTDLLEQYSEGLIAMSACLAGVVNAHIVAGDMDEAVNTAKWYKGVFGDDFYLELQNHELDLDGLILEKVPKIAKDLSIKLVASNDAHYIKKEDALPHNVLLHIQNSSSSNNGTFDVHNLRYGKPEMYLKTQQQMIELFSSYPGAIENSMEIAAKCDVDLKTGIHMPIFKIPPTSTAKDNNEYLREITFKGMEERYSELTESLIERVNFELDVIIKMDYASYFLIVQDLIQAARDLGVRVGPGRGSAAGSLVAYALKIINVDPMKHDLLFERFLNPDRVSMPDIDIDFSDDKRDRVITYVKEKYGEQSVAQIITFNTLSSKAVLKDVGRVLGIPLDQVNKTTKCIPTSLGKVMPIGEAMNLPDLAWLKNHSDPRFKEWIEYSKTLEGFARNSSVHAAGVVIAPSDITDFVPLYKAPDSDPSTQYTMKDLEEAGLLKMDFLGLRTLSIIDNTLEMIKRNHGIDLDIDAIDYEDELTYKLIGNGDTLAIFQFESDGMQSYLKKLKPQNIEELTAMNALYRPGPMENIPEFIDRKQGKKNISYLHPLMERSLKTTYGVIVYQEQVMQLVRDLAGFTLAQSDIMRRAMGKKDEKTMNTLKAQFTSGAASNGISDSLATEIFNLILKFASYGFNKSHSLAYSYLAFQTAYLKAHYTAEFLAANMSAELNDLKKIVQLIEEAKKFGFTVIPPNINKSFSTFTVEEKKIIFGLSAIKNVGSSVVDSIISAREDKPFESLFDFVTRVDNKSLNKRGLEALICSGAFDCLENGTRAQMFAAIEISLEYAKTVAGSQEESMDSLFGEDVNSMTISEPSLPMVKDWTELERLQKEKEFLNFYVSGHPMGRYILEHHALSTFTFDKIDESFHGKDVQVCGLITENRTRIDKSNRTIAFPTLEDMYGRIELVLWADIYEQYRELIDVGELLCIQGEFDFGEESAKIKVTKVQSFADAVKNNIKSIQIRLPITEESLVKIQQLQIEFEHAKESIEMQFVCMEDDQIVKRFSAPSVPFDVNSRSIEIISRIFGKNNIRLRANSTIVSSKKQWQNRKRT